MSERRLYLLRHATARPALPIEHDHDRALSEKGESESRALGRRLADARIDRVLCSSARRTLQTWAALERERRAPVALETTSDLYDASATQILECIVSTPDSVAGLLVVAHNPGIAELAWQLAGGSPQRAVLEAGMRPCALAIFELDAATWYGATPADLRCVDVWTPPR